MTTKTEFPTRPRRDDANGHMTVWTMVQFLRDAFDTFQNKFARGSSTVLNGNTTVVVTHGLGSSTYSAVIQPLGNPGGNWWITNKTATQFTVNLAVAAPVGGVPFDWIVKGA